MQSEPSDDQGDDKIVADLIEMVDKHAKGERPWNYDKRAAVHTRLAKKDAEIERLRVARAALTSIIVAARLLLKEKQPESTRAAIEVLNLEVVWRDE